MHRPALSPACAHCLWGGTRILLADGRSKQLAHLELGEAIYGSVRAGERRLLTPTRVLAKWSTLKPAHRIVLHSGGELLASGDHRFLTTKGWRYVSGGEQGAPPRAHLVRGDRLLGLGETPAAEAPRTGLGERELVARAPLADRAGTVVRAVKPLRMAVRMYDITTGTGDFIAGGVVSHNCCARPTCATRAAERGNPCSVLTEQGSSLDRVLFAPLQHAIFMP